MELQEIGDRLEIQQVLVRYTRAIDTGEWDRLDTVFTADAAIDYTESGGIADAFPVVKAWLAENLPIFPRRMHTLGQSEVTFGEGGDVARVAAYFHNPMTLPQPDGSDLLVEFGGIYHHEMVRTADGWRSRRLHEELVWKRGM
ncbi:nuclear transport factor 2 family protein [Nocardioides pacificus]